MPPIVPDTNIVSGLVFGGHVTPLFSSMYPRIKEEKYTHYLFETAIETLGEPKRDIKGFFMNTATYIEISKLYQFSIHN